ncbi:hypothetical protein ACH6CV_10085 [Bacillota bacterium Meth-B3]
MKLKSYAATLVEKMSEFDLWVTPSLGDIRETEQFRLNLQLLKNGFDICGCITNNYETPEMCSSMALADNAISLIAGKSHEEAKNILDSIFNVLLLATGKTDNNLKCQFPLMLQNEVGISSYPVKNSRGQWRNKELPRTISLEDVTKTILGLAEQEELQKVIAESYFHLVISDEQYARQLWSLGSSYVAQKLTGDADSLISSIVIFQSRGSITATQGHIPEEILRNYMHDWGLQSGFDFNTQDVEIGDLLGDMPAENTIKKRKYDFIIPYQSRRDGAKIFIQSQFYAGDSGSVSHKVVDQTDSTRNVTKRKFTNAVFVEYLDGAGYYASLNGDLRKMLAKPTTKEFIQIRTAPIKLRRELQGIRFLTTLEIEHAIIRTSGDKQEVYAILAQEDYSENEIGIAINEAINAGLIHQDATGALSITQKRAEIVRKYCLLDIISNYGCALPVGKMKGCLMVSGNKTYFGMPQDKVIETALKVIPQLDALWESKTSPFRDLQALIEQGLIILK